MLAIQIRRVLGSLGVAAAIAVTGTGTATAADHVTTDHVTTLQLAPVGIGHVMVANFTVDAITGRAPGVVRFRTVSECYVLNPISAQKTCIPTGANSFRVHSVQVRWLNVNTGATGVATIPVGSAATPLPEIDAVTGSGRIVVTTAPETLTLLPGFGSFDVP